MELLILGLVAADLSAVCLVHRFGRRRTRRARLRERLDWIRWEEATGVH
jgi:hypothetical protein